MKDIAFAFDSIDGRRVEIGLDVKGYCLGPSRSPLRRSTNMSRLTRMAQDQLTSDDAIGLVRILLTGLPSDEAAAFRDQLAELLNGNGEPEPAPNGDEPPPFRGRPRPGGSMDRLARDSRLPRGMPSFAERFPNASKVRGEASARTRTY
jgi:hypothetical protein